MRPAPAPPPSSSGTQAVSSVSRADAGKGVPYALDPSDRVVEPEAAQHRERFYRCLVCGEHVFLKAGNVRVAHFSHYAKREAPCSAETALHEAAKRRLAERIRAGLPSITVRLTCRGHPSLYGPWRDCPEGAHREHRLDVPTCDTADVEVPFGPFRLDAAALDRGQVVLGLEVYQSNAVDDGKQVLLNRAKLPWLELRAHDVMHEDMPWALLAGSLPTFQCPSCTEAAEATARQRAQLEAEERQRAERERFQRQHLPIARQGRKLVRPNDAEHGAKATCLGCDQTIVATRINGRAYWSHPDDVQCNPRRAWIRAGMLALYNQLQHRPEGVKIIRRCEGSRHGACDKWVTTKLPSHDHVDGAGTSLVLRNKGAPVAQITFDGEYEPAGAPLGLTVRKPSRLLKDPTTLIQPRDGSYCPTCQADAQHRIAERKTSNEQCREAQHAHAREPAKPKTEPPVRTLLRNVVTRGFSPEERGRALHIARDQLATLAVDAGLAAGYSVTVRECHECAQETVTIEPYGLPKHVPHGLEALLEERAGAILARCIICGALADAKLAGGGVPVSSARLATRAGGRA